MSFCGYPGLFHPHRQIARRTASCLPEMYRVSTCVVCPGTQTTSTHTTREPYHIWYGCVVVMVSIFYVDAMTATCLHDPVHSAVRLQRLGETARRCQSRSPEQCRRPDGHSGHHFFTEDDASYPVLR